jgi:hypothetical protein
MTTTACFLATLLALLTVPFIALLWVLETPADRARRWHQAGVSQRQIAVRLQVSRHRVRAWVMA